VRIPRQQAVDRLREQISQGRPIIGASAGTGLSAKCAEAGDADLIIIYNSGRYRMAGRGSAAGLMPYGDANAIVVEMAGEVLPVVQRTPVIAGVCGTDPFRQMPIFLEDLKRLGFSGVQNFPTVGLFEGAARQTFEETGMGFGLEVEMVRTAHELDMLTVPYVFNDEEAAAMAEAGADVLVPHMGTTTKGAIGAQTAITMDECVERIASMRAAARAVNPDIIVLCHGGPIAEPQDAQIVLDRVPGVVGFVGASSMERLPVERAITETMNEFKSISFATGGVHAGS
jgi:predicted TIM-barrel enzyme